MLSFLDTIIEYIKLLWEFFLNFLQSLLTLLLALVNAVTLPPKLIAYAPSFMSAFILAVTSIAVIKLILGRNNT